MKKSVMFDDLKRRFGPVLAGKDTPSHTLSVFPDPNNSNSFIAVPGIRQGAAKYIHFARPHNLSSNQRVLAVPLDAPQRPWAARSSRNWVPDVNANTPRDEGITLAAELEQIQEELRGPSLKPDLADKALSISGQLSQVQYAPSSSTPRSREVKGRFNLKNLAESTMQESHDVLFQAELERGRRHARRQSDRKAHLRLLPTPSFAIECGRARYR